jgi:hypothetical protein
MKFIKLDSEKTIKDYKKPLTFLSKKHKGKDLSIPINPSRKSQKAKIDNFVKDSELYKYQQLKDAFEKADIRRVKAIRKKFFAKDKKMQYYIDRLLSHT